MANTSSVQVLATINQRDNGSLVQILSDEKAQLLIPAMVYISVMMVLGLVGNVFVCFYYTFKEKKSTNTFFIVVLSVCDLLTSVISMPSEIAILTLYYTFDNNLACKTLKFVTSFTATASILTLVAIATDRFKRICRATRPQMDIPQARRVSVILVLISILLSLLVLFIYEANSVPIVNNLNLDVYGHTCSRTKAATYRVFVFMYQATHFLLFVVPLAVLSVLYSIIGRSIYHHRNSLKTHSKHNCSEGISVTSTSFTIQDRQTKKDEIRRDKPVDQLVGNAKGEQFEPHLPSHGNSQPISNEFSDVINETNKVNLKKKQHNVDQHKAEANKVKDVRRSRHLDADTVRVTILMVIVTLIFFGSFLPYLSFSVWVAIEGRHEALFLSDAGLVVYHIGFRSFLLNSALNPWIYGIFNSQFRRFYFGWWFRKSG